MCFSDKSYTLSREMPVYVLSVDVNCDWFLFAKCVLNWSKALFLHYDKTLSQEQKWNCNLWRKISKKGEKMLNEMAWKMSYAPVLWFGVTCIIYSSCIVYTNVTFFITCLTCYYQFYEGEDNRLFSLILERRTTEIFKSIIRVIQVIIFLKW